MTRRSAVLFVVFGLGTLSSACSVLKPDPCGAGSYLEGSVCVDSDVVTIQIGPGLQPTTGAFRGSSTCYAFSPNTAYVTPGQAFRFQNGASVPLAIQGEHNPVWVNVAPGTTSGTLKFDAPSSHPYGVANCANELGFDPALHKFYGHVIVTVGR